MRGSLRLSKRPSSAVHVELSACLSASSCLLWSTSSKLTSVLITAVLSGRSTLWALQEEQTVVVVAGSPGQWSLAQWSYTAAQPAVGEDQTQTTLHHQFVILSEKWYLFSQNQYKVRILNHKDIFLSMLSLVVSISAT